MTARRATHGQPIRIWKRWFAAHGQSLFWDTEPCHFSVQEMLANAPKATSRKARSQNRFANKYDKRPKPGRR